MKRRPATGETASSSAARGLEHAVEHGVGLRVLLRRGGLERRDALGRQRGEVLVLREPRAGLGGLALVALDGAPRRVVAVDLLEELVDELGRGDLLDRLPLGVDHPHVLGARDAEVRMAGLTDAVDRAAEHRDLDRVVIVLEAPLDLRDDTVHVELQAPACRARDQVRAALTQLQRLQDLPRHLHLFLGVEGGQRDANRVPDSVGQQRAEPDGGLQRARPLRPGLGDAEVQRVRDALREETVRRDRVRHGSRLHGDLEVAEVEPLHELDGLHGGAHERLHRVAVLKVAQVLRQRSRVDADPQRRLCPPRERHDLGDLFRTADVAGVQAHAVRAGFDRLQRKRVVEMDVRDHRDRRGGDDRLQGHRVLLARDGHAHDVGAGVGDGADLLHRGGHVRGLGLGHRLHGDRGTTANRYAADVYLAL